MAGIQIFNPTAPDFGDANTLLMSGLKGLSASFDPLSVQINKNQDTADTNLMGLLQQAATQYGVGTPEYMRISEQLRLDNINANVNELEVAKMQDSSKVAAQNLLTGATNINKIEADITKTNADTLDVEAGTLGTKAATAKTNQDTAIIAGKLQETQQINEAYMVLSDPTSTQEQRIAATNTLANSVFTDTTDKRKDIGITDLARENQDATIFLASDKAAIDRYNAANPGQSNLNGSGGINIASAVGDTNFSLGVTSSTPSTSQTNRNYNLNGVKDIDGKNFDYNKNMATYTPVAVSSAVRNGVDPDLGVAIMYTESKGNPLAQSKAGAKGLMQIMPRIASAYGVTDSFNPEQNIEGAMKFLGHLSKKYNGNPELIAKAYFAGETAMTNSGNNPQGPNTLQYAKTVMHRYGAFKGSNAGGGPVQGSRVQNAPVVNNIKVPQFTKPKYSVKEQRQALKGVPMKGNQATAGGSVKGETLEVVHLVNNMFGKNITHFSGLNDKHTRRTKNHSGGVGIDVTFNNVGTSGDGLKRAKAMEKQIHAQAKAAGYIVETSNEYDPVIMKKNRGTAPHMHITVVGRTTQGNFAAGLTGGGKNVGSQIKQQGLFVGGGNPNAGSIIGGSPAFAAGLVGGGDASIGSQIGQSYEEQGPNFRELAGSRIEQRNSNIGEINDELSNILDNPNIKFSNNKTVDKLADNMDNTIQRIAGKSDEKSYAQADKDQQTFDAINKMQRELEANSTISLDTLIGPDDKVKFEEFLNMRKITKRALSNMNAIDGKILVNEWLEYIKPIKALEHQNAVDSSKNFSADEFSASIQSMRSQFSNIEQAEVNTLGKDTWGINKDADGNSYASKVRSFLSGGFFETNTMKASKKVLAANDILNDIELAFDNNKEIYGGNLNQSSLNNAISTTAQNYVNWIKSLPDGNLMYRSYLTNGRIKVSDKRSKELIEQHYQMFGSRDLFDVIRKARSHFADAALKSEAKKLASSGANNLNAQARKKQSDTFYDTVGNSINANTQSNKQAAQAFNKKY